MDKRLFKTKLEALIACRNHWYWLAITGDNDKITYKPARNWDNECACCDYVGILGRVVHICEECPLANYAWPRGHYGCVDYSAGRTAFLRWIHSESSSELMQAANRMVYACNQAIEDYLLNDKED